MTPYLDQARRLHAYLLARHWDGRGLLGPDSGVRLNYRAGRFVKSALPLLPWRDDYYYLQAQAYWVLASWGLAELTGEEGYRAVAVAASDEMLAHQAPDGSWAYPNPEWSGRVASAEGTWAALGLLATARATGAERFLAGAARWHGFLEQAVGYRAAAGGVSANYFAGRGEVAVPNTSAFVLRFLAELAALGVPVAEGRMTGLLGFLRAVQRQDGELPYALDGRDHFQCFQYNAFQCLDLLAYHEVTGDGSALDVARGLAVFVATGVAADGSVFFDCRRGRRAVVYHAAAVAAALSQAARAGVAPDGSGPVYRWVLAQQRPDGGFPFSRREHLVLRDRRSYPRNLAMILLHLLLAGHAAASPRGTVR